MKFISLFDYSSVVDTSPLRQMIEDVPHYKCSVLYAPLFCQCVRCRLLNVQLVHSIIIILVFFCFSMAVVEIVLSDEAVLFD